jgi:hypothetical protein
MAHEPQFAREWHRCWGYVSDVALTLWVLRAPVAGLLAGYLILWFTPQAQDLLVDLTSAGWTAHFKFFALVIFVWAMPTEYAATILLNTDERYCAAIERRRYQFRQWLRSWLPSILGALVFVCMLGSVVRSLDNVPRIEVEHYTPQITEQLILIAVGLFTTLLGFLAYVKARPQIAKKRAVVWADDMAGKLLRPIRRHLPPIFAFKHSSEGCSDIIESELGPVLLILLSIFFLALPMAFPLEFAGWFPRASVVPFVIGAWIPLLSFLSGLGRRLHFPIITTGLVIKTLLPLAWSPNYEIRVARPGESSANAALDLNEAVRLWKRANQCDDESASGQAASGCPRPIIVAAAGGASRAGFFTASVLGELLDHALPNAQREGSAGAWPGERLFALSTVSGSSVAAVMTVAAMAASPDRHEPCRSRAGELWFGTTQPFKKPVTDWRDCLETVMSGDFLTPVFVGLMFHDTVRFFHLPDRGSLLENAFERHFSGTVEHGTSAPDCAQRSWLECPFMSLRPTEDRWLPLLVLNGTSVGSGQRILTTALENTYKPAQRCPYPAQDGRCRIFVSAFRFHDLLRGGGGDAAKSAEAKLRDVRLSTAAHNSARFPVISPPGEIYDADNHVVDRMVDGGYFENFGAQTATELAEAIVAIDHKLKPFVLVLSNDPTVPMLENVQQSGASNPDETERAEEGAWITDVSGPVKAFIHTRNARGVLAVDSMPAALARAHPESCNVVQLRVWYERKSEFEARAISMSWWLSKPVQVYLHQQANFAPDPNVKESNKRGTPNRPAVKYLLDALDEPPTKPEEQQRADTRKGFSVERVAAGPQACDQTATTSAQR